MNIRVLGCSGSIAAGSRTTSFLVDDDVLIDAGSGVGDLTLEELARIDHIFISHSHLDHVLSIGLLADSVMRVRRASGRGPITVHALPETVDALRQHIFNNVIWPDFTRLPTAEAPILRFQAFAVGEVVALGARRVEVLSALHTVPAVGFAVMPREGAAAWIYTGDTAPNPELWARLRQMPVAHLVIETAFGDDERQLAEVSRHLCPSALVGELARLADDKINVHITHIKPGEVTAVMGEIAAFGTPYAIKALATGQILSLP
jgi:cAMP phosphodiesterase